MSDTIFGHRDSNDVVYRSELMFLWVILNNIDLDSGSHLVRYLAKVGKASMGNIVIGGKHLAKVWPWTVLCILQLVPNELSPIVVENKVVKCSMG